jgi:hypothetical protein
MANLENSGDRKELTYPSNPWNVVRAIEGALGDECIRDRVVVSMINDTIQQFSSVAYQFISAAARLRKCIS